MFGWSDIVGNLMIVYFFIILYYMTKILTEFSAIMANLQENCNYNYFISKHQHTELVVTYQLRRKQLTICWKLASYALDTSYQIQNTKYQEFFLVIKKLLKRIPFFLRVNQFHESAWGLYESGWEPEAFEGKWSIH